MRTQGESWRRGQSSASIEPLETRTLMAGDVVLEWNAIAIDTTKALVPALTTQRQTRMMAMVHGAVFDAVNSVERGHEPYLVQVDTPRWASAEAAAAVAAHGVLVGLVPAKQAAFDAALATSLAAIPDGRAEDAGAATGRAVAADMLAHRRDDGFDAVVPYTPGTEPDDWQPTPPAFAPPVTPQLATTDPFAIRSPDQFRAEPPPSITSDAFTQAFDEVKAVGAINSTTRTAEQTEIARYWVGPAGTVLPPGQWNRIARTVATAEGNSMAENARLFALLNFGMADAQISCWDTKYTYNFVRPVTAIRNAANDGNPGTDADPAWTPLVTTPAHPSYTSGHSTVSAAAATVLGNFFSDDSIAFTDTAELSAGGATVTRSFDGFWDAAEEAASSRLYAGIHWSFDNEVGLAAGRSVGAYVAENTLRPRAARRAADPDAPVFPPALSAVHGVDGADWDGSDGSDDGLLSGSAGLLDGLFS
jgi:membrane-associated phospholipid phosphatase